MKKIETACDINASVEKVWQVLMDFSAYVDWNPFIPVLEGEARLGAKLIVKIIPVGKKPMVFKPVMTVLKEPELLRWRGKFLLSCLFDGEHSFELTSLSPDKTRLSHYEKFSGLLVPLVLNESLTRATESGFRAMNEALKQRCEA